MRWNVVCINALYLIGHYLNVCNTIYKNNCPEDDFSASTACYVIRHHICFRSSINEPYTLYTHLPIIFSSSVSEPVRTTSDVLLLSLNPSTETFDLSPLIYIKRLILSYYSVTLYDIVLAIIHHVYITE